MIRDPKKASGGSRNELPVVSFKLGEESEVFRFMLDSGSTVNLLSKRKLTRVQVHSPKLRISTLGGSKVSVVGNTSAEELCYGHRRLGKFEFGVTDAPMNHFDGILGIDFLVGIGCLMDFKNGRLLLKGWSIPFESQMLRKRCTLLNLTIDEDTSSTEMVCSVIQDRKAEDEDFEEMERFCHYVQEKIRDPIRVRSAADCRVPPKHTGYLKVRTGNPPQKTAYIEPELLSSGLVVGGCCITTGCVTYVPVINVNDEGVNVKRGEPLLIMSQ
jgi:hypothetical protein